MTTMYCPSCHKQVQSTFAKCPYCSLSFSQRNTTTMASVPVTRETTSIFNKIKKFIITSLCIMGIIAILFVIWAIKSTPSYTSSSSSSVPSYTSNYEDSTTSSDRSYSSDDQREEIEDKPDFMNAQDRMDIPPQYRDALEPIDDRAVLDSGVSRDDFLLGLSAIRAQGYKCKSISSVGRIYGGGVRYSCNNFSKQYEVTKEDGVFQVKDKS